MPQKKGNLRLSPEQTKQFLDDYAQYRFRQFLSAEELARKTGVKPEVTQRLMQQQPVGDADLTRVANALNVSVPLLREICGLDDMSSDMLETLNRFFAAQKRGLKTRERGGH